MNRRTTTTPRRFSCETCGADAGPSGIACPACELARVESLLNSRAWREVAATRSGDQPGESLLDTIRRERASLLR